MLTVLSGGYALISQCLDEPCLELYFKNIVEMETRDPKNNMFKMLIVFNVAESMASRGY